MFFSTTTLSALMASVGEVSTGVFDNVTPYLYIAVGIPLAFYIVKRVIGMLPKGR